MTRPLLWAIGMAAVSLVPLGAQDLVFRAVTNSVSVDVSVHQGGRPVADLSVRDFEVRDNGVLQTVSDLSRETLPIDLTLVVDVSRSVTGPLLDSLERARAAVNRRLMPTDRVRLITFNDRVREVHGFELARPSVTTELGQPKGATALFDALALSLITSPESGRRQMAIVFTDGQDTISFLDETAVIAAAQRSEMSVFVVALAGGTARIPQAPPHAALFATLADTTGGEVQVLQRNQDLGDSFVRAFDEFRTSYVLRYTVAGSDRAGWHALAVRITRPGRFDVRARKGYFGSR